EFRRVLFRSTGAFVVFGKKIMSIPMDRPQPGSYHYDGEFQQQQGPYFGPYGSRWMPESLMAALQEVEDTFRAAIEDPIFLDELRDLYTNYVNQPSLLTEAERFAQNHPGGRIFLKREDLNHTGSHRSIMSLVKLCWLNAWAKPGLLLRPEPDNTVSQHQLLPHCSV